MKRRISILAALITLTLVMEVNGLQFSASGRVGSSSGAVSQNIQTSIDSVINGEVTINGASVMPATRIIGATPLFKETHRTVDGTKSASVSVEVVNAPNGLTYSSQVLPGEGTVPAQTSLSAEQWLTVPKADSIKCTATASSGALKTDVGLEETKGSLAGDYVTLSGYDGKAVASASSISASQTAISGSAYSIKIYGDGTNCKINSQLTGISGGKATFSNLNSQSSANKVTQKEHVSGKFTSKITAGSKTLTRTSNYGTDYDLDMTASGSSVLGILGYYVSPANTIQGAVNAANTGDWINIAAGTYKENIKIDKSLVLNGLSGASNTIIDGQQKGSVLTIGSNKPNIDTTLTGLTIQNGKAQSGGGIQNYGRLTTTDCIISGNLATLQGGGIYNEGTLNLNSGTSIANNVADNNAFAGGGGIYSYFGTVNINGGASITNNKATHVTTDNLNGQFVGGFAGGIYSDHSTVTMNGGTVSGNTASFCTGGIYNDEGSILTINDGVISGNSAIRGGGIFSFGSGGGVVNTDKNTVVINGGLITGNTATLQGAGVFVDMNDKILITGGTISNNVATQDGGGVFIDSGSLLTMTGGTITGNSATAIDSSGGGLYLYQGSAVLGPGVSISNNKAVSGGGIYNDASKLTLTGVSINGNTATWGAGILNDHGTTTLNGGTSISGNSATKSGGGIYNIDGGKVINNGGTVTGNTPNDIVQA